MIYALITRNFQIEYVARYTSRSLSLLYTLSAFYAGQEGSLLFWSWILSIFTAVVIFQNKNKNRELMPHVLLVLTTVIFFFTFLMIVATNPFKTFNYTPFDGQGFKPVAAKSRHDFSSTDLINRLRWIYGSFCLCSGGSYDRQARQHMD